MSIRFIFGPAGSGKSVFVQNLLIDESIKNPKENFILVVPDQFTMQTQMDIVKRHPNKGILNIDVLSFGRLSYRVFSVTGAPSTPVLDDTGKSLILRRVASKVSDSMPYLGPNLNKIGFNHEIKSQISEFMQYGISVKDVEKLAEKQSDGLLKKKLSDLAVIYKGFMEYKESKFITSEETLDILGQRLELADFVKGSTIVFDGFTGFTPIQERVVLKLSELAKEVIITFDLSLPEKPKETGGQEKLFYLSRKGANRLKSKAEELRIEVGKDYFIDGLNGRFTDNPELDHLEKNLFRFPSHPYDGKCERVNIFTCSDMESEVSRICLLIHELVRTGKYAYRDIAVVTGNLDGYGILFEDRMRELNMPVFIDRTYGIVLNPFIEYLKSALQILIKDYSFDAVFHFLRSGFTSFTDEETDRFERYISSLNIRGKNRYHKEFKRLEKGVFDKELAKEELVAHEDLRKRLMSKLSILEREGKTAGDYVRNLYDFLKDNSSYEKLLEYQAFFEEENDLAKAKEYSQIYKCIMDLLDTIVALIGDEEMPLEEFYRIFEAGIGEIQVGTIPKNVDRIVVGDIERTRMSEVKVLFFAGVNDGNIPKNTEKGGILSETDRNILTDMGYDLAPTPREEMYTQRLYLYMNLCKPVESLYISYAGTDREGKGMRPSYLIEVLKKMFPGITVKNADLVPAEDTMVTLRDSLRFYARLLRDYVPGNLQEAEKKLTEALLCLYKQEGIALSEEITDSAFTTYIAEPLSEEIVRMLYGNTIRTSISRMETYAGCAYAYFLQYGMGLKENEEYDFASSDLGNIYHGVLDLFSLRLEKKGISWLDLTEEESLEMIESVVKEYCEDYEQGMLTDDEQSAYTIKKITKIMQRTISTLKFHLKSGKFVPTDHEYSFERELDLKNGKKMLLRGKVDRIDIYEEGNRVYVKILDYKSGTKSIDVTEVYLGLQQQLSVYMAEALHRERVLHPEKEIIPSAMLYYKIDNPIVSATKNTTDEDVDKEIKKDLRPEGLYESSVENIEAHDEDARDAHLSTRVGFKKNSDDFDSHSQKRVATKEEIENMLLYVERLIKSIGDRINEGDKRIYPMCAGNKDACTYCKYKTICRFDEKIPGYKKRDDKGVDADEARNKVMGGEDDGLYLFD